MTYSIPNVVHFIYPVWTRTRPLSYLNYLAVKFAKDVQQPDKIKFWVNKDPEPSQLWDGIKELVEVNYIEMNGTYKSAQIEWPQLQSDVTRLEILYKEGGIYMDTDMLLITPLHEFRNGTFTMCLEPYDVEPQSACNALMMAEPGADFANLWLSHMEEALKNPLWAYGGVVKPLELANARPDLVSMLPYHYFCPFDLKKNWLFSTDEKIIEEGMERIKKSFAIHAFETYWRDVVKDITPRWAVTNDSVFSRLVMNDIVSKVINGKGTVGGWI